MPTILGEVNLLQILSRGKMPNLNIWQLQTGTASISQWKGFNSRGNSRGNQQSAPANENKIVNYVEQEWQC